jgi:hypothetical protein
VASASAATWRAPAPIQATPRAPSAPLEHESELRPFLESWQSQLLLEVDPTTVATAAALLRAVRTSEPVATRVEHLMTSYGLAGRLRSSEGVLALITTRGSENCFNNDCSDYSATEQSATPSK